MAMMLTRSSKKSSISPRSSFQLLLIFRNILTTNPYPSVSSRSIWSFGNSELTASATHCKSVAMEPPGMSWTSPLSSNHPGQRRLGGWTGLCLQYPSLRFGLLESDLVHATKRYLRSGINFSFQDGSTGCPEEWPIGLRLF